MKPVLRHAGRYAARICLAGLLVAGLQDRVHADAAPPFGDWLAELRAEARAAGIGEDTLAAAFRGVEPIPRVIELDRRQPEFTQTFWTYMDRAVSADRVERGRALLQKHAALLAEVERRHGVQPRFLVAFWGLETNYGDYLGGFPVIGALATLAHDTRRSGFFRSQLMDALRILEGGHIEPDRMLGSWAGAMGQPQFMPSTFVRYAADGDGDGRKDIWTSLPDVFHSAANYLASIGWSGDETWGREVRLPDGFDLGLATLEERRHIAAWQALGVRRADGSDLPSADIEGSIVLPAGYRGPAFLVYGNFHAIMTWNRSILYALAVGHLSDRLVGLGRIQAERPVDDAPLSRNAVLSLQEALNALGFDAGEPDGMVGPRTRAALRDYQRSAGLPPDGYPTPRLIEKIEKEARTARNG